MEHPKDITGKESEEIQQPIISVIVPCYNVEKYLKDCLNSLINQTLKNIEIICINDGSTDSTGKILDEYSKLDKRIIVINQENLGVSAARNNGIKKARAKYIGFTDSDDWVDLNYFETLLNTLEKNNCDISIASIIRKRKCKQKYRVHYQEEKTCSVLKEKIEISNIPKCCYIWNKLYKAQLIKDFKFKEGVYFEDMLWLPEIINHCGKVAVSPETNYYYRVNNQSIVKKLPTKQKQKDSYNAHKYIIEFFKENNLGLTKKQQTLTKEIKYFLNIPIIKIKEYKGEETSCLFGLIPVFKRNQREN